MASTPVYTTEARLAALNRLYDAVSDHIVENPSAPADLANLFLPVLEDCRVAAQEPDLSGGAGENVRADLIELARMDWGIEGKQEVDDGACLSVADDAIWIQGWVRFSNDELASSGRAALAGYASSDAD